MALLQTDRLITLTTPLGPDVLLVQSLEGTEAISSLFHFKLALVSEKNNLALNDLVGQRVTFSFALAGGKRRYVNGFVSRFAQGEVALRVSDYYMEVVPWLWFLTRTTDCRIFQHKSVPDIIKQIFKDLGFTDFKLQLQGSYEPREYCVQYRETDFNFVSRLMEEEGIFYFFEHTDSKHTLILADTASVYQPCPGQPQAHYDYLHGGGRKQDMITHWQLQEEYRSGKFALTDYYFETPSNDLRVSVPSTIRMSGDGKFELYDYPGYYAKRFDGDDRAGKVRPDGERTARLGIQGEEALHTVVHGVGTCRAFVPGYKFEMTDHRRADFNGSYVLTKVSHAATNNLGQGEEATYDNTFICIPATVTYRPPRITPKPLVHGSQTAVVVGLKGTEIDCDKYGRVRVQFHWDREGKKDQNSSCWIRVGTPWAGKGWGMIHIPRIGQEVIVHFLEGDPDQPLIIGSVYNAEQMPPYALPGNKTQSGIQSRSSLGGSPANYNEIRFEDKKGSEQLEIHAEKDQVIGVENDESHWVGHDRTKTIDHDETTHVKHDRTETVDNNEKITIGNNRTEMVGVNETITIGNNRMILVKANEVATVALTRTHNVGVNEMINVGAAQEVTVGGLRAVTVGLTQAITVGTSQTLTVGTSLTETIGTNHSESAGGNYSLSVGKDASHTIKKKLTVTAGEEIVLKTGNASIIMKKDGTIYIKGKDITVEGSGQITGKASKDMVLKGKNILQN